MEKETKIKTVNCNWKHVAIWGKSKTLPFTLGDIPMFLQGKEVEVLGKEIRKYMGYICVVIEFKFNNEAELVKQFCDSAQFKQLGSISQKFELKNLKKWLNKTFIHVPFQLQDLGSDEMNDWRMQEVYNQF